MNLNNIIPLYGGYRFVLKNVYTYSVQKLKDIAACYDNIYQGIEFYKKGKLYNYTETNPWEIAEFKADFDMALNKLGQSRYPSRAPHWTGEIKTMQFSDCKWFGRLQQIVIADILGMDDYELAGLGFYDIPRLRGYAYHLMKTYLNGE